MRGGPGFAGPSPSYIPSFFSRSARAAPKYFRPSLSEAAAPLTKESTAMEEGGPAGIRRRLLAVSQAYDALTRERWRARGWRLSAAADDALEKCHAALFLDAARLKAEYGAAKKKCDAASAAAAAADSGAA